MNQRIVIITEGESDSKIISKLLSGYKNVDIISAGGFSSALTKAQALYQQNRHPFLIVLDTDVLNPLELKKKKKFVNDYFGINSLNSIGQVVWMEPEMESIFVRNPIVLKKIINRSITRDEFENALLHPKDFLAKNNRVGFRDLFQLLNDPAIASELVQDRWIKEIINFIEIKRGLTFSLSTKKGKKDKRIVFKLETQNDFIAITKSYIPTLFGKKPNDWFEELMKNDIYFQVTLTKAANEGTIRYVAKHFQNLVSPYHAQPVFEDYLLYPAGDKITDNSTLEIEVFSKVPNNEFEVQFHYDATKGVSRN